MFREYHNFGVICCKCNKVIKKGTAGPISTYCKKCFKESIKEMDNAKEQLSKNIGESGSL